MISYNMLCFEHDGILKYDAPSVVGCYLDYPVSFNDIYASTKIELYPNPTADAFTIKSDVVLQQYTLFSQTGQRIEQKIIAGKSALINLSALSDGIYFLNIEDTNGHIITKKVTKYE